MIEMLSICQAQSGRGDGNFKGTPISRPLDNVWLGTEAVPRLFLFRFAEQGHNNVDSKRRCLSEHHEWMQLRKAGLVLLQTSIFNR